MSFNRNQSRHTDSSARIGHVGNGKTPTLPKWAHENSNPEGHLNVSSNWSDRIPVGEAELAVLERYLAEAVDQLIGPKQKRGRGTSQARGPP
jgi:hypothetical protein